VSAGKAGVGGTSGRDRQNEGTKQLRACHHVTAGTTRSDVIVLKRGIKPLTQAIRAARHPTPRQNRPTYTMCRMGIHALHARADVPMSVGRASTRRHDAR
jgi:hypothetical protein